MAPQKNKTSEEKNLGCLCRIRCLKILSTYCLWKYWSTQLHKARPKKEVLQNRKLCSWQGLLWGEAFTIQICHKHPCTAKLQFMKNCCSSIQLSWGVNKTKILKEPAASQWIWVLLSWMWVAGLDPKLQVASCLRSVEWDWLLSCSH